MTKALDRQLRQLLLRQLAPEDVARMEEAILMEDGVAERLREEEFDLIDDYVQGRLSTAERADMERYVLTTPERMASLRVARALAAQRPVAAAEPVRSAPRAHWKSNRMLPVATLLAAGIAGVALIPQWGVNIRPVATAPTPLDGSMPTARRGAQPSEAAAPLQSITLLADTARGGPRAVVRLASGMLAVRLQAEVPGPARDVAYALQVDDAAGRRVFEVSGLAVRVAGRYRFVEVSVPAEALGPGARTISLRAAGGAADGTPPEYRWQIDTLRDGTEQKK